MEILLGGGIVGCMFVLYWSVACPEVLIDAILFKDSPWWSSVIIFYIFVSVFCVALGLHDITTIRG